MVETEGSFRWALILDGEGGCRPLDWDGVAAWDAKQGPLWLHLDRQTTPEVERWLETRGLDLAGRAGLLAEETRPRAWPTSGGLLVILRGVNLNPGKTPDDMISLRLWVDPTRLVSVRVEKLFSTTEARAQLEAGRGPQTPSALLVRLITIMTERIQEVLEDLDTRADELEEGFAEREVREVRSDLLELRRQVIALRRFLSPQRAALTELAQEPVAWIDEASRAMLRELADRATRIVEHLEELRERAGVIHDEIANRVAEQVNQRMFFLTLATAVFLPLSFLTGLLGINVGGIPGSADPQAFTWVVVLLLVLGAAIAAAFRFFRWI